MSGIVVEISRRDPRDKIWNIKGELMRISWFEVEKTLCICFVAS